MTESKTAMLLEKIASDSKESRATLDRMVIAQTRSEERIQALQADVGQFQELCSRNTQKIVDMEKLQAQSVENLRAQFERFKSKAIIAAIVISGGLATGNAEMLGRLLKVLASGG